MRSHSRLIVLAYLTSSIACNLSISRPLPTNISPPTHPVGLPSITIPYSEQRSDGAERLTIPPDAASDQNPAFSPDGSRLVFTRFINGYNHGPAGLFLLDLASGQVTRLTPFEDQDNVNLPGSSWNPGNQRIIFSSDRQESDDLWRIASDGSDFSRVTYHEGEPMYIEPTWSSDGDWIIFEGRQPGGSDDNSIGHIWKVRSDGSELTQLTDDPVFDDRQPNWSPTGQRILFQRRLLPDGEWDIFTMNMTGDDLKNVTANPASDTDASWSPDGMWIVTSSNYGGQPVPNIFAFSIIGGGSVRITTSTTQEDGAPSWSTDGKWIAFESHSGQEEDTPTSLWRIRVTLYSSYFPTIAYSASLIEQLIYKERKPWTTKPISHHSPGATAAPKCAVSGAKFTSAACGEGCGLPWLRCRPSTGW